MLAHSPDMLPLNGQGTAQLPATLMPAVLLTFREKVRPDAARTLAYFRQQGVRVVIISGDDPRTVAAVAQEVGLEADDDGFDGRRLPTDAQLMEEVLERYTVFGASAPRRRRTWSWPSNAGATRWL